MQRSRGKIRIFELTLTIIYENSLLLVENLQLSFPSSIRQFFRSHMVSQWELCSWLYSQNGLLDSTRSDSFFFWKRALNNLFWLYVGSEPLIAISKRQLSILMKIKTKFLRLGTFFWVLKSFKKDFLRYNFYDQDPSYMVFNFIHE